ncbi:hypothetical protein [Microbulbifer litoralis]|uniref:hypothetical protein n=1 Tax=Microbulbifer litoralis TaxID=2933965 RepID=UPI0020279AB6|nr:hypothetical protein [Microbulbifer sp. GX H0434]
MKKIYSFINKSIVLNKVQSDRTLFLFLAFLLTSLLTTSEIMAQPILFSCQGTTTTTYDPALTNENQFIISTVDQVYSNCILYPEKAPGTLHVIAPGEDSCTTVYLYDPFIARLNWNDGTYTEVEWINVNAVRANGMVTVTATGKVTSGFGLSASPLIPTSAEMIYTTPQLDLVACANEGISTNNGVTSFTLIGGI